MPNYVGGVGPNEPDLMIIGKHPGREEDEQGIPFVGTSGELVNDCIRKAGMKRSDVFLNNVVKYQPPFNDIEQLHLIGINYEEQVNLLWEEIRTYRPKCILVLGEEALKAVVGVEGILNYRGSILTAKDGVTKVVATIHPAALIPRGDQGGLEWTYLRLIEHDFRRAAEERHSRKIELPERHLEIADNSIKLARFENQYAKLDKAIVDIESINCVPVCIGFAFNKQHAISVPLLTHIGKNRITDMGYHDLAECYQIIDRLLRRLKIGGHNFKYDDFKLGLIGFLCKHVYTDTLIKTRVIFPELPDKRLCVTSSLWTREPFYKDDGKEFRIGKQPIENLMIYNGRDCAVNFEVDEEQEKTLEELSGIYNVPLKSYYYDYMMKKHKFYLKLENTGFAVDHKRKAELLKKYTDMAAVVHEKITKLVGHEVNVNSYPQMYHLLYEEMRFKKMKRNPTSEDTIVALLGNHAKTKEKKEILENLLEERRIRTQKSRYISFNPDYDGRCKTSFNISATETCRSSTSVLNKPVRPKKIGLPYHTIAKHGRLAKDIRSMFICDPGYVIIGADSGQAEARVVAVLAEDWELLTAFDTIDIHRRTAGLIFGYTRRLELGIGEVPIVDDLEKDGPERFCGKKTRHAGNYRMGKNRFMVEFNTDAQKYDIPMSISEWRAGQMLELFNGASPKIKDKFHADIIDCLESSRVLIDPFGGVRIFNGRMGDELHKEGFANIPQRTVAHLVQGAALKCDEEFGDADYKWLSEDHDSLKLLVPAAEWEKYARVLKKHMTAPIDFRTYCSLKRDYTLVIPCDIEMSDTNYAEMKKVKVS